MRFLGGKGSFFSCAAAIGALLALSPEALAKVKHAGTWPGADKKVTLDVARVPRDEAIRQLAEAAGWSVVVHAPQADPVDIHVKDQPADKILDLLLMDADYVATRDGTLVSIQRVSGDAPKNAAPSNDPDADPDDPIPAIPPIPPIPAIPAIPGIPPIPSLGPMPPSSADAPQPPDAPEDADEPQDGPRDREVMGQNLKIAKDEVVDDVAVMGGSLDVYGTVKGDISVAGGAVRIHEGAHVHGDVSAVGGDIRIEDGAKIDGEVAVRGGSVHRGDKASVGGSVHGHNHSSKGHTGRGRDRDSQDDGAPAQSPQELVQSTAGEIGSAFARMALLFVFGTVLLALTPERMDNLKAELVARPMRSFAMGVLGTIGAALTLLILCVTVIGVPFALVGALVAVLAFAAALCAVLETVGRALLRHKSQNPYLHLAVGCFLFLALTSIPYVGPAVVAVTGLFATGILVSTRMAGLIQKKNGGAQPYRAAPAV